MDAQYFELSKKIDAALSILHSFQPEQFLSHLGSSVMSLPIKYSFPAEIAWRIAKHIRMVGKEQNETFNLKELSRREIGKAVMRWRMKNDSQFILPLELEGAIYK